MSPFAAAIASLPCAAVQEPVAAERLLATIPSELSLEGAPFADPNGKTVPGVREVVWSADGSRVAYVGLKGNAPHPVFGDQVGERFDYADPPVFSADGAHVAFRVGKRVSKTAETWWVLIDGKLTGKESWIGSIALGPSGELAYWTQPDAKIGPDGAYSRGAMVLATPWKRGKSWSDAQALRAPVFSADGSMVATLASKNGEWSVLAADKKGERELGSRHRWIESFALRPDGREATLVVFAADAGPAGSDPASAPPRTILLRGKEELASNRDAAGCPVYSSDGKHVAYKFVAGDKMGIAVDGGGGESAAWDFVSTPIFSPGGEQVAFVGRTGAVVGAWWRVAPEGDRSVEGGRCFVVLQDARGRETWRSEACSDARSLAFDPSDAKGARIAFAARSESGWSIVCGERRLGPFDEVGTPCFAPGGRSITFGARSGRELWQRRLDLE